MPKKNKRRSCKKAQAGIAALPKKFSPEEQEAWGMALSKEAEANIRTRLALPDSQLNEILDRTLTDKVHTVLEANGKKTGPKFSAEKNQRMVEMLHGLSCRKALKEVVRRAGWYRGESAQLLRFCVGFYELASMLKKIGTDKNERYVMKALKERFGFNLPADWPAVKEAYRRGFLSHKRPHRYGSSKCRKCSKPLDPNSPELCTKHLLIARNTAPQRHTAAAPSKLFRGQLN